VKYRCERPEFHQKRVSRGVSFLMKTLLRSWWLKTGGVIRLSAAVAAGQLLVLANLETKREVIVQILRKRSYKPTMCYLEVEFVEAAPRFWGTEFSAATALLPKNTQDVETAALVITAEAHRRPTRDLANCARCERTAKVQAGSGRAARENRS